MAAAPARPDQTRSDRCTQPSASLLLLPHHAGSVMVTDAAETPFSSLSRVGHGKGGMPVHKLFSAVPLQVRGGQ